MTPSGNRRRPRSGAPERPDLQQKAERIHAEVFGHPGEPQPENKPDHWVMRILAGYIFAAVCWGMSKVLYNEYLLMFSLSLAVGMVFVTVFRALWRCKNCRPKD
jgi:hypothetical protein